MSANKDETLEVILEYLRTEDIQTRGLDLAQQRDRHFSLWRKYDLHPQTIDRWCDSAGLTLAAITGHDARCMVDFASGVVLGFTAALRMTEIARERSEAK